MKRYLIVLTAALSALTCQSYAATSAKHIHWEYKGKYGQERWGDLSPEFIQCKVGLNQSPIDIKGVIDAKLPPLQLDYKTSSTHIVNNGHTAQVDVQPGNFLLVEGEKFELVQFHLHAPSEHSINGKRFLMETHFVHKNTRGELAVVALLHQEGAENIKLAKLEAAISREIDKRVPFRNKLSELEVISGDHHYFRYNGSLTTPPCSEGVRWFVLKEPRDVSLEQQEIYIDLIGEDSRGPQPINSRIIVE